MNVKTVVAAGATILLTAVACNNQPKNIEITPENRDEVLATANPADLLPTKSQTDSVSYLIGVQWGAFVKNYNFGDINFNEAKKGFEDFINAKGDMQDPKFMEQLKISPELIQTLFNDYLEKRNNAELAKGLQEGNAFLEKNKNNEGVQVTESGLQYVIKDPGSEVKPSAEDKVVAQYKGTLIDGTVFDESDEKGVEFPLNRVIPAWTEGLQLIGEGGEIDLYVPANLGYGERGTGKIKPNSVLIFNVKLKEVKPAETKEEK